MKIIPKLFFLVIVLSLTFLTSLYFLPGYLSHNLIPTLSQKNGFPPLTLDIDAISHNSIHFSHLRLKFANKGDVYVESGYISYTLKQLFHGELQNISLNGLQCYLPREDKTGKSSSLPKQAISNQEIISVFNDLPIHLANLQIHNSHCNLQISDQNITIPFNLDVHLAEINYPYFDLMLTTTFQGNLIKMAGFLDLANNIFLVDYHAEKFPINNTNVFLKDIPFQISTIATFNGQVSGTAFPFRPQYKCLLTLNDLEADYLNLKIGPPKSAKKENQPVTINFTGDSKQLNVKISAIPIRTPISAVIETSTLKLNKNNGNLSGNGHLVATILATKEESYHLPEPVSVSNSFDFSVADKTIRGNIKSLLKPTRATSRNKISFTAFGHLFQSSPISLSTSGRISPNYKHIQYKALAPFFLSKTVNKSGSPTELELQGSDISLTGTLTDKAEGLSTTPYGDFSLSINELSGNSPGLSGKTAIILTGKVQQLKKTKRPSPEISAMLELKNGQISLSEKKVTFSDISASIPLAWPLQQNSPKEGALEILHIIMPAYDIGSLTARINLKKGLYNIDANLLHKIIPRLSTPFQTTISPGNKSLAPKATIIFTVPKYHFDSAEIDLPMFNEIKTAGNAEVHGFGEISAQGITGSYDIAITDTTIQTTQGDISVDGLNLTLNFPNIAEIKSGPSELSFQSATVGQISFGSGQARFQLENIEDLFVENSTINWNSGKIHLLGTRITSGEKKQAITLYCEGLNLAGLLSQLGVAQATGEGQVNGKISLSIKNGILTFSDAFLYSTPGTGGTIKINNSKIILSGISSANPHFGQLDFASTALNDFRYKWVTMNLNTVEGNTLLALKLAGKAAKPLPFRYDTTKGTFIRLSDNNKGIDYPINLDVNFHLPLNKILNYGTNLKDIFTK